MRRRICFARSTPLFEFFTLLVLDQDLGNLIRLQGFTACCILFSTCLQFWLSLSSDSNSSGSYYYQNDNGSTYYNAGNGYARYTGSSGGVSETYHGNSMNRK